MSFPIFIILQLGNLQNDYERVQKRHGKQSSNAEKARDQSLVQLQDTQAELLTARNQIQVNKGFNNVSEWYIMHELTTLRRVYFATTTKHSYYILLSDFQIRQNEEWVITN